MINDNRVPDHLPKMLGFRIPTPNNSKKSNYNKDAAASETWTSDFNVSRTNTEVVHKSKTWGLTEQK